ncbi:hypothetical protein GF325_16370 [Candidatus Bathyarchaeota archaeon]|nr:hypothetical protein [Candidatus Bathyarchaeota archaeon]
MVGNKQVISREFMLYAVLAAGDLFIGIAMLGTGSLIAWLFIAIGGIFILLSILALVAAIKGESRDDN